MVRQLATSGAGVEVVVGKAGAGKTTALAVTRKVFESAGYAVTGTALSARAAEELALSVGIPSMTLARFLGELDDENRVLGPHEVLMVDEAGMVGTRTIGRLIEVAALGTRPAFVGEQRRYDRVARNIDTYREHFGIDGSDPLGPRPFETFPRLAYDEVTAQIRKYEEVRWREMRPFHDIRGKDIEVQEIAGIDTRLEP
jgi:hypothetical protein